MPASDVEKRIAGMQKSGGKDGTPFPVDRQTYDRTVETLQRAMARARVDRSERIDALKRLSRFSRATEPDQRPSA